MRPPICVITTKYCIIIKAPHEWWKRRAETPLNRRASGWRTVFFFTNKRFPTTALFSFDDNVSVIRVLLFECVRRASAYRTLFYQKLHLLKKKKTVGIRIRHDRERVKHHFQTTGILFIEIIIIRWFTAAAGCWPTAREVFRSLKLVKISELRSILINAYTTIGVLRSENQIHMMYVCTWPILEIIKKRIGGKIESEKSTLRIEEGGQFILQFIFNRVRR